MKKTFKDYLQSDLNQVFFNENEFASYMKIDDEQVKVVIDGELLKEYNGSLGEGLTQGELLFYAPVSEFSNRLFKGKEIRLRGKRYSIDNLREDEGVYYVVLVGMHS